MNHYSNKKYGGIEPSIVVFMYPSSYPQQPILNLDNHLKNNLKIFLLVDDNKVFELVQLFWSKIEHYQFNKIYILAVISKSKLQ